MRDALDWPHDGTDWPLRESSRFIEAGGVRWHVQVLGSGPALLLLHGTGASTHSWRDLAPRLAEHHTVIAPDLPGHAFTGVARGDGMSLPGMGRLVAALLAELRVAPQVVVGHSAGAAIALRMAIDGRIAPAHIVSLNGAFVPFEGVMRVFSPIARLLVATPFAARLFSGRAHDPQALSRLIAGTGSRLDARGEALYGRLVRSPAHVHGALAMMAAWNLDSLEHELRRLQTPVLLVAGSRDKTVAPAQARRIAASMPQARVEMLDGLGHLAHEEDPARVAALVDAFTSPVPPASPLPTPTGAPAAAGEA